MKRALPTRKFGKLFYIVLLALSLVLLALLGVWAATGKDLFLYLLLGVVPFYFFNIIYHLVKTDKDYRKEDDLKSGLCVLARDENARVVHLTYFGGERHIAKPSSKKREYLAEFYTEGVDIPLLKRHLWFDLPAEEEKLLHDRLIGDIEIPFPLLLELKGKTVLVPRAFYEAASASPAFYALFSENEIVLYGDENE